MVSLKLIASTLILLVTTFFIVSFGTDLFSSSGATVQEITGGGLIGGNTINCRCGYGTVSHAEGDDEVVNGQILRVHDGVRKCANSMTREQCDDAAFSYVNNTCLYTELDCNRFLGR